MEFGEKKVGDPVNACAVSGDGGVVPSRAAPASGGGPELVTALGEKLGPLVAELGGEGTRAQAGGVCLNDGDYPIDPVGGDPGAGHGTPGCCVRAGHKRVCAVVNIQHCRLAALEQHRFAAVRRLVKKRGCVGHGWPKSFAVAQKFITTSVTPIAR